MKAGAERLDVTSEELAALVEGVRATLGEAGYQKARDRRHVLGRLAHGQPGAVAFQGVP
jgi:hypothetical protein